MATPRRRSSRIKGETPSQINATPIASKLSSLVERDESPPSGAPRSLNTLLSSPLAPPNTAIAQGFLDDQPYPVKTPQTASRIQPSLEEMHPSKVHQSTVKPSASRQGFGNILSRMAASPSKVALTALPQHTPSKTKSSLPGGMTSPNFDFSFERPESDLSIEAQKIMDSVREEAAKIKSQMLEERSKQAHKDGETDQLYGVGGRKIAKPKSKSGRYSDIHKLEFKKMDSIAGHASLWKNKVEANAATLKRSPSKAGLDEPLGKLPPSKSFKILGRQSPSDRLENNLPGKRAKQNRYDDTSSARPVSRDTDPEVDTAQAISAKVRPHSGIPSTVTTPTKASLARSVSAKSLKTSMNPSLSRSASTKTLRSPAAPKTEGSNKYRSSFSRFGSMKSILHRSQPKFSDDPVKVASGTHLPLPHGKLDLEKKLPSLPATPTEGLHRSPTMKRVGFTSSTKSHHDLKDNPPSPSKIPTPLPLHQSNRSTENSSDSISYPNLGSSPNITTRTKIPKASAPGDFTFRSEKLMDFSLASPATVVSPGNTIRHVRPSGVSTPLSAFSNLPSIPHGMSNKKRRRVESDTEAEDEENVAPTVNAASDDDQPKAKKQRLHGAQERIADAPSPSPSKRRQTGSKIPKFGGTKDKARVGISLGRLNMLARPKERRQNL